MFHRDPLKANTRLLALVLACAVSACSSETPGPGDPNDPNDPENTPVTPPEVEEIPLPEPPPPSEWEQRLAARRVDYARALRGATLRLAGVMPTLDETLSVSTADAAANKTAYEAHIDRLLADPRFSTQMINFWRDTFRMGGNNFETAPTFAAMLTVNDSNFLEILTAKTGGCPTFANGVFTVADCPATNAPGGHSGVLTNPGMIRAFYGPMTFRPVKWVQETFVCSRFPAETDAPKDLGNGQLYTGVRDYARLAGGEGSKVDFRPAAGVVCANCHNSGLSDQATLYMNFDNMGVWQATPQAKVPVPGEPTVQFTDYLVAGTALEYRAGKPITTISDIGTHMAADPAIAECAVARMWNWAMGRADIVDGLADVDRQGPSYKAVSDAFKTDGKLKTALGAIFKSDDYVKF